jgi:hypothetical protein
MDSSTKIRTCPVGIEIAMHLYYSPNPSSFEGTLAFDSVIEDLGKAGIVEWATASGSWESAWRLTAKGKAWVELICHTPYPIHSTIWKDPRTNESISSM